MILKRRDFAHLICQEGTSWPQPWANIPASVQKDFLAWAQEYKQQDWSETPERGWEIYDREYIAFILLHEGV